MKTYTLYISEKTLEELKKLQDDISVSEHIRRAIEEYLKQKRINNAHFSPSHSER